MFKNQSLNVSQPVSSNTSIFGKANWIEPELTFAAGCSNVDMNRLIRFIGIKMKPIGTNLKDCRHGRIAHRKRRPSPIHCNRNAATRKQNARKQNARKQTPRANIYSARAHSAVFHQQHTNPKRKRGNGLLASLALRVSIIRARAEYRSRLIPRPRQAEVPESGHESLPVGPCRRTPVPREWVIPTSRFGICGSQGVSHKKF